jgi:DNA-binding transcriptional MerR regulator
MSRQPQAGAAGTPAEYTISQLAQAVEVTPRAIRFYEQAGLLSPRRLGTMRVYTRRDRARLLLILRGKRLGFTLAEIREWLDLYDAGDGQVRQARVLLEAARARIAELERQREDLTLTLAELRELERKALRHLEQRAAAAKVVARAPAITT